MLKLNYRAASIIGGVIFVLGLILCSLRSSEIIRHKIVSAKVTSVDLRNGECRRVSGKYGVCTIANVGVEFPINKKEEMKSGKIEIEHPGEGLQVGASVKVMFLDGHPDTVRLADFSSGWKGPLGVVFLGALILIVSSATRSKRSSSE